MDFSPEYITCSKLLAQQREEADSYENELQTFYMENMTSTSISIFGIGEGPKYKGQKVDKLTYDRNLGTTTCGINGEIYAKFNQDNELIEALEYPPYGPHTYEASESPYRTVKKYGIRADNGEYDYEYLRRNHTDGNRREICEVTEQCNIKRARYSEYNYYIDNELRKRTLELRNAGEFSFKSNMEYDELGRFVREELDYFNDGTIDEITSRYYDANGAYIEQIDYKENDNWNWWDKLMYSVFGKGKMDIVITRNEDGSTTKEEVILHNNTGN